MNLSSRKSPAISGFGESHQTLNQRGKKRDDREEELFLQYVNSVSTYITKQYPSPSHDPQHGSTDVTQATVNFQAPQVTHC